MELRLNSLVGAVALRRWAYMLDARDYNVFPAPRLWFGAAGAGDICSQNMR
jgi:hypothetical protein